MISHWVWWHLGLSGSGPWSAFFSGLGSDLSELALLGGVLRMINCHEPGCHRLGHHIGGRVVCHRHREKP